MRFKEKALAQVRVFLIHTRPAYCRLPMLTINVSILTVSVRTAYYSNSRPK